MLVNHIITMSKAILTQLEEMLGPQISAELTAADELALIDLGPAALPLIIAELKVGGEVRDIVEAVQKENVQPLEAGAAREVRIPIMTPQMQEALNKLKRQIRQEDIKRGVPAEGKRTFTDLPSEGLRKRRPRIVEDGPAVPALETERERQIRKRRERGTPEEKEPLLGPVPLPRPIHGRGDAKRGIKGVAAGAAAAAAGAGLVSRLGRSAIKKLPDAQIGTTIKKKVPSQTESNVKMDPKVMTDIQQLRGGTGGTISVSFAPFKIPKRTHNNVELVRRSNAVNSYVENLFNTRF